MFHWNAIMNKVAEETAISSLTDDLEVSNICIQLNKSNKHQFEEKKSFDYEFSNI